MEIKIVSGKGDGVTELAAFDKALFVAGIANYNLLPLSSVIPAHSEIKDYGSLEYNDSEYGYRLYLVMAEKIESRIGKVAVAGIGWVKHPNNDNSGLFVEFGGESVEEVEDKITKTLTSMTSYRPEECGEIKMKITEITCEDKPVCALSAAVYKSEGWE